jgi:ATP-dependent Clp protease protease subunit
MLTNPYVVEQTETGEKTYDLYSRLMRDRIVMLGSVITDEVANNLIAQLLFLEMDNPNKDIQLYINSPGGSVSAGLAIYDILQFIKCDVATYCLGTAASMASLLLMAGTPGKRFAMPNSRIVIHQPHLGDGKIGGQVTDIVIHAKELLRTKGKIVDIYRRHSGHESSYLHHVMERDHYMTAEEAQIFGLIDQVISTRKNQDALTLYKGRAG